MPGRCPDYYTQACHAESARRVLGGIDLDPASCAEANERVKATRYYAEADDGLSLPWSGRLWLNPPWGGGLGRLFLERLIREYDAGTVSAAVVAFNSHSLFSAKWATALHAYPVCFAGRRIHYHEAGGALRRPAYNTAWVYLGPDDDAFAAEFSRYGTVMRRVGGREAS